MDLVLTPLEVFKSSYLVD